MDGTVGADTPGHDAGRGPGEANPPGGAAAASPSDDAASPPADTASPSDDAATPPVGAVAATPTGDSETATPPAGAAVTTPPADSGAAQPTPPTPQAPAPLLQPPPGGGAVPVPPPPPAVPAAGPYPPAPAWAGSAGSGANPPYPPPYPPYPPAHLPQYPAPYGPPLSLAAPASSRTGEAPVEPRPPHRWGLGAYLLVEATFLALSALLGYLLDGRLRTDAGAIALALAVPTVGAAALAIVITWLRGNGPVVDLGLRVTGRDVGIGVACGLAGLVITIPASVLYVTIVGASASSAVAEVFGNVRADPAMAVLVFVIVVFVAPFCEEVVYRGLLWGAVEKLGARRWWAMAITTVVFALAHFELTRTPLLLIVALPIGVARVLTGRLPAGIVAHQINNLLPGLVLMLGLLGAVPLT